MPKNRQGDLNRVANTKPKRNANQTYHHVRVQNGKKELHLLLTDHEVQRARHRAEQNPEDLLKAGWLRDLLD